MPSLNTSSLIARRWKSGVLVALVALIMFFRFHLVPDGSLLDKGLTVVGVILMVAFFVRAYYRGQYGKSPW